MATIKEIEKAVNSGIPIIWINSFEERRIIEELINSDSIIGIDKTDGVLNPRVKFKLWSASQGLVDIVDKQYLEYDTLLPTNTNTVGNPTVAFTTIAEELIHYSNHDRMVVVIRDFHKYCTGNPMPIRKLRDLYKHLAKSSKFIIITGPSADIPDELQKEITYINFEYPTRDDIRIMINNILNMLKNSPSAKVDSKNKDYRIVIHKGESKRFKVCYTEEEMELIVKSAQGLTKTELTSSITNSIHNNDGVIDYKIILKQKEEIIKRSEILEMWSNIEDMENVGGNEELKTWLLQRKHALTGKAANFGIRPPKGVLFVGVPGSGKSLFAKAISQLYNLPLVRIDFGKIFAGLVGSSEKNMRNMIAQIESLAPAILFADEIEKGLSGTDSSNFSDGGTSSRVFGTFIQWMTDKTKPIFIVATANDVSKLPAELLRKGRFDQNWFIDLPSEEERRDIFKIHLKKIKPISRDPKNFDINKLAATRYERNGEFFDYSGAEIEEAINDALFAKYSEVIAKGINEDLILPNSEYDINTNDILNVLATTIPISCTAQEKIAKIRKWGQKHARFASSYAKDLVNGITKSNKKHKKQDITDEVNINNIL